MKKRRIVPVRGSATVSVERARAVAKSIKAERDVTTARTVTPNAQQKYLGHFGSGGDVAKRPKKKLVAGS